MSTLDEISKEKQRVSEALARVETQREELFRQLDELATAERVLVRYGQAPAKPAATKRPITVTKAVASEGRARQPRTAAAKPNISKGTSPSLGDQVLALATGKTQQEIAAACKGARPNHVGVMIARHKRAGRIEERDGKLYATQSAETIQGSDSV
jgi:hypothetical protein